MCLESEPECDVSDASKSSSPLITLTCHVVSMTIAAIFRALAATGGHLACIETGPVADPAVRDVPSLNHRCHHEHQPSWGSYIIPRHPTPLLRRPKAAVKLKQSSLKIKRSSRDKIIAVNNNRYQNGDMSSMGGRKRGERRSSIVDSSPAMEATPLNMTAVISSQYEN
jgi:hypothetical protein